MQHGAGLFFQNPGYVRCIDFRYGVDKGRVILRLIEVKMRWG